jgi:hypothetical protein
MQEEFKVTKKSTKAMGLAWCLWAVCMSAQAQSPSAASVPYTPSWTARHYLQWLSDHAGLPLTGSHWPLPAAAVEQALNGLAVGDAQSDVQVARDFVRKELAALQSQGQIQWHWRTESEALNGFAENYTPGSSAQLSSPEVRHALGQVSVAGRLGGRVEASPNSLQTQFSGMGAEGKSQLRPDGSAAVLGWQGWNVQAFAHTHWWGPGWQSSLVNGHNNPAWTGVGVQRGSAATSDSAWLRWMGPWNLDVFVAKAQDPLLTPNQPSGFLFSGMRLTMKPQPWLEVGLSRGLQTGGAGRPNGARNFVKAFFGQELNKNPEDTFVDSSGQLAGYDVRLSCPKSWSGLLGSCAAYTQWMGEDAAGKVPLPYKFMSLWGLESTYGNGQYRVFAEWADTNGYSLPWDNKPTFPGYVNGVYTQGYTQGARWVGSAQGSGSRVMSVGWMDAANQRLLKLHVGNIKTSLGSYDPRVTAPQGDMWSISASQVLSWKGMKFTPEMAYTHLSEGDDQRANKRKNLRLGMVVAVPL